MFDNPAYANDLAPDEEAAFLAHLQAGDPHLTDEAQSSMEVIYKIAGREHDKLLRDIVDQEISQSSRIVRMCHVIRDALNNATVVRDRLKRATEMLDGIEAKYETYGIDIPPDEQAAFDARDRESVDMNLVDEETKAQNSVLDISGYARPKVIEIFHHQHIPAKYRALRMCRVVREALPMASERLGKIEEKYAASTMNDGVEIPPDEQAAFLVHLEAGGAELTAEALVDVSEIYRIARHSDNSALRNILDKNIPERFKILRMCRVIRDALDATPAILDGIEAKYL